MSRGAVPTEVALDLRPDGPLRHRIADAVVAAIAEGRLAPGDTLPPSRTLARQLEVARGSVVAAYDELLAAGYVDARPGSGTRVAAGADRAARAGARTHVEPGPAADSDDPGAPVARWDLRPGHPDTATLGTSAWRSAWSRSLSFATWPDYEQHQRLRTVRTAVADHLRRRRGIAANADQVVLMPGVSASFLALPDALGLRDRAVAVEDPGYRSAHSGLARGGARVRPVPVDDDGLDPALLEPSDRAVYVTPAHQYPLGGRLPVARRVELLDWARSGDRWILEDDYDGDFRYDVAPLPPLRSLPGADTCVVYLGTASKILSPGLRVAWAVLPEEKVGAFCEALDDWGLHVSGAPALALGDFLAGGRVGRHIAAMARLYAARRAALVTALARHLPGSRVLGLEAGLHVVLALPDGSHDRAVESELELRGVLCSALSRYAVHAPHRGLVLGYANLPETAADQVASHIAAVVCNLGSRAR